MALWAASAAPAQAGGLLQGWELNWRAYVSGMAAYVDGDLEDFTNRDPDEVVFGQDAEIRFVADKLFDNGMQMKLFLELEAPELPTFPGDTEHEYVDEAYLQVLGAFGTVQFGLNDGILDQKILDAPRVFRKNGLTDTNDVLDPFERATFNGVNVDTEPDFSGDDLKLTWMPPVELLGLYGLKLGISYTPFVDVGRNDFDFNTTPITDPDYGDHYFEVAAGWESRITDAIGVGVSAGYGRGSSADLGNAPQEWFAGAQFTYVLDAGKIVLGGAYTEQRHSPFAPAGADWNIGLAYEGDAWTAGISYADGQGLINDARDGPLRDQRLLKGGVTKEVLDGLRFGVGVDWLLDDSAAIRGLNNGQGSESVAAMTVIEFQY